MSFHDHRILLALLALTCANLRCLLWVKKKINQLLNFFGIENEFHAFEKKTLFFLCKRWELRRTRNIILLYELPILNKLVTGQSDLLTENYNRLIRYLFTNLITYLIFNIVVAEQKLLLPMIPFSRPLVLQSVPKLKKCQKPLVYHLLLTEDLVPLLLFWNTCCYAFMLGEMIMMDLTLRILMCLKDSWNHIYQNLSITEKKKIVKKAATKIFPNDLNFT